MGWRFQKRVKIAPGLRLNLSKTGISTTAGVKGLSVNTGKNGTYLNAGLPGSGLSTRTRMDEPGASPHKPSPSPAASKTRRWQWAFLLVSLGLLALTSILFAFT